MTNALRHSGAGRATVLVRYDPARLELTVDDDGRGLVGTTSGGHGLVGVRERVALYGGSVHVSTGTLGGVRLFATLPEREVT